MQLIEIRGARTHNLKNIHVALPRDQLVVITGLSGSGKSSLAFDTLYAEGQRRYVESLSAYARQFLSMMEKPDVDHIEGLSPAISIEQKSTSHNPRSTVGTVTEIYDYLRLLFARVGQPRCPKHQFPLSAQTISQMVDQLLNYPKDTRLMLLAPLVQNKKGDQKATLERLQAQGFVRIRVNGTDCDLDDAPSLDKRKKNSIDVIVDRLKIQPDIQSRLADSLETTLQLGHQTALARVEVAPDTWQELLFSSHFACPQCGYNFGELEPRLFSFNSPIGACSACDGLGANRFIDPDKLISNEKLSLAQGAIRNWDKHHFYHSAIINGLIKKYKFSWDTPYEQLAPRIKQLLLYGTGEEPITLEYVFDGESFRKKTPFEGIIPMLERRYRETDSEHTRQDIHPLFSQRPCPACRGTRLKEAACTVFVGDKNLPELTGMTIEQAFHYLSQLHLEGWRGEVALKILKEITARLKFLLNVGLNYLTLGRSAETLSGGEAQRIRLASQLGAGLVGVMYVLDEPSIGLHQRDNARLLEALTHLRDLGNTVIVVEHDEEAILTADHVIDMGPGAGVHGGSVVAQGTPAQILKNPDSLTGQYLSGQLRIEVPKERKPFNPHQVITIQKARGHNLKNITVQIPAGLLTCVTGVSGSGKSTLINDTLFPTAHQVLNGARTKPPLPFEKMTGLEQFDKVISIDQSPIGRTPRSNAATYTGLFTEIRELFTATPEAKIRGYGPGRFSFNVKGGRCEACQGDGLIKVEMHFLADVYVNCDVCLGKRYNRETLEVLYKGKNIHEVLEMSVEAALDFFSSIPRVGKKLETLAAVGLSYLKIGQSATTLSGGEAQRLKLSKELARRDTGRTLYILDEPTTGLHFHDIKQLLGVLKALQERGNTIVIIEHNLDVIKTADWIIDLGPEGGSGGGQLLGVGSPETLAAMPHSHTGRFLRKWLKTAE